MDQEELAEASFERLWASLSTDKARLRSLNERDKAELKAVMKSIYMTSLESRVSEGLDEINVNVDGIGREEVEDTVRSVLREELGGLTQLLAELRDRPAQVVVQGNRGSSSQGSESGGSVVELHGSMFESEMKTNLDEIKVSEGEVGGVKGSLDALRKLRGGSSNSSGGNSDGSDR